jgi:hypothetical protein
VVAVSLDPFPTGDVGFESGQLLRIFTTDV